MMGIRILLIATTVITSTCYGSEEDGIGGGIGLVSPQSIDDAVSSSSSSVESEMDALGESSTASKNNNVPSPTHIWGHNNNQQYNDDNEYNTSGIGNSEAGLPYLSRPRGTPSEHISLGSKGANDEGSPLPHGLPAHFQIKARLLSNLATGHSYFEDEQKPEDDNNNNNVNNPLLLPFTDCSNAGISTPPITIRHATFRHLPPHGSTPTFSPSPHPQLIICLYPLQITTSNGQIRSFAAGDVIWMDDIHGKGHLMTAVDKGEDHSSVLILSLKDHVHSSSLPCPNDLLTQTSDAVNVPSLRKLVLGTIGIGLSSALTYFLARVAPHVLAVGVGGLCMVVGGTSGVVIGGEKFIDTVQETLDSYRTKMLLDANEEEELVATTDEDDDVVVVSINEEVSALSS